MEALTRGRQDAESSQRRETQGGFGVSAEHGGFLKAGLGKGSSCRGELFLTRRVLRGEQNVSAYLSDV